MGSRTGACRAGGRGAGGGALALPGGEGQAGGPPAFLEPPSGDVLGCFERSGKGELSIDLRRMNDLIKVI